MSLYEDSDVSRMSLQSKTDRIIPFQIQCRSASEINYEPNIGCQNLRRKSNLSEGNADAMKMLTVPDPLNNMASNCIGKYFNYFLYLQNF